MWVEHPAEIKAYLEMTDTDKSNKWMERRIFEVQAFSQLLSVSEDDQLVMEVRGVIYTIILWWWRPRRWEQMTNDWVPFQDMMYVSEMVYQIGSLKFQLFNQFNADVLNLL